MELSRRSRQKFADLAAGSGTIRNIEDVYGAHGFDLPPDFKMPESGQRRAVCAAAEAGALHQDGAPVDDDGKLVFGSAPPVLPVERFDRLDEPRVLLQHLERIDAGIQKDPAAAIGAAKELVESARLAANSARAVVEFLLETWHSRRDAESPTV